MEQTRNENKAAPAKAETAASPADTAPAAKAEETGKDSSYVCFNSKLERTFSNV